LEREEEKAAKKKNDADVKLAEAVLAKMSPTLKSLQALVAKPAFESVAPILRDLGCPAGHLRDIKIDVHLEST
jgi:hypothetical protein